MVMLRTSFSLQTIIFDFFLYNFIDNMEFKWEKKGIILIHSFYDQALRVIKPVDLEVSSSKETPLLPFRGHESRRPCCINTLLSNMILS